MKPCENLDIVIHKYRFLHLREKLGLLNYLSLISIAQAKVKNANAKRQNKPKLTNESEFQHQNLYVRLTLRIMSMYVQNLCVLVPEYYWLLI